MSNPLAGLKTKGVMVPVEKIEVNTFVRSNISQDRIDLLKLAIEGDAKLPPIVLVPSYEVTRGGKISPLDDGRYSMVDGRHRFWVHKNIFDCNEVSSIVVSGIETEAQLISIAFQLNGPDGPLPPDTNDIEHTVEELLKRKVSKKEIPILLGLPDVVIRKFVNDVEARLERATVYRAFQRVVKDGLTVADAAKAEGTAPEKVRNFIASGRRKRKQEDVEEMTREIARLCKSLSGTLHANSRIIGKKFADGDITADDGIDLFGRMEQCLTKLTKIVKDNADRFIAKAEGGE